jgi:hypothetical protein
MKKLFLSLFLGFVFFGCSGDNGIQYPVNSPEIPPRPEDPPVLIPHELGVGYYFKDNDDDHNPNNEPPPTKLYCPPQYLTPEEIKVN